MPRSVSNPDTARRLLDGGKAVLVDTIPSRKSKSPSPPPASVGGVRGTKAASKKTSRRTPKAGAKGQGRPRAHPNEVLSKRTDTPKGFTDDWVLKAAGTPDQLAAVAMKHIKGSIVPYLDQKYGRGKFDKARKAVVEEPGWTIHPILYDGPKIDDKDTGMMLPGGLPPLIVNGGFRQDPSSKREYEVYHKLEVELKDDFHLRLT